MYKRFNIFWWGEGSPLAQANLHCLGHTPHSRGTTNRPPATLPAREVKIIIAQEKNALFVILVTYKYSISYVYLESIV